MVTMTMKPVTIQADGMSNSVKRKLSRLSHYDERDAGYHIAAYLIAQLGRNFNPKVTHPITGKRLMTLALQTLNEIQYSLGGLVVYLECEEKRKASQILSGAESFQEICRTNNGKRGRNGAASIGSVDELFIRKDTRKAVKRGPREYGSFLLPFMTGDGGKGYGVCEKGCRRN